LTRTVAITLVIVVAGAAPRQTARLHVDARDRATGAPVPARFYLTDAAGAAHTPPGVIAYERRGERHFVADGGFDASLPPGRYEIVAERGPEYLPASATVNLQATSTRRETLRVPRWVDMNARGWYSGDLHNHRTIDEVPALLRAEDLNVAPTLTDWIWEDKARSTPPQTSDAIRRVDERHMYSVLDKEVERLEQGPGAVNLLGLRSTIPFEGYRLHPPDAIYCERARAQGGYIDAEKIVWRDGAALVALGLIDFVGIVHNHFNRQDVELETDRWGMIPKWKPEFHTVAGMPLWSMEVYYHLLNCGFRLPVSAGSASGVKAAPLGYNRVYVNVDGPFSYDNWFRSLKAGRSFATNGPMLFLSVEGLQPGSTVRSEKGPTRVSIRAQAISPRPLDRIELVADGRVIHAAGKPDAGGLWLAHTTHRFDRNGWIVARAFEPAGRTIRFAHTSPVYVDVGRPASATADARFFLDWIDREMRFYRSQSGFREPRHREEMLAFFEQARDVYARLAK